MSQISQQGNRYHFDAIVIGSGLAGLCFCLELVKQNPNTKIALISKKQLSESNSRYAQGGIASVDSNSNSDSLESHINDTLNAGDELCNSIATEEIIKQGPKRLSDLIHQGVNFDKNKKGQFDLAREGGHSHRRIYHHGDVTGEALVSALIKRVLALKQIQCFEFHIAINLITQSPNHIPGSLSEVIGAYILDEKLGLINTFMANTVTLATGGAGKVYRYTSNPEVATGDGIAMAYRVGARVGNMEFYQFHPTLLYHREKNNFLISEALRGEGAYLRLPETGERFLQHYNPDKMELATRDVIARAIFTEIEKGPFNSVYLDIRHKEQSFLQQRFPTIDSTLKQLNIDMSQDLIPVVPAAHYLCGGVLTDVQGQTDLQRLYAIGETAFTGLHGANRLASNSLLEAAVMGYLAAQSCSQWLTKKPDYYQSIPDWNSKHVTDLRRASQINAHWRGLRGEMTSYAGIIRTEAGLKDLLKLIYARSEMIEDYYWKHTVTRDFIELRNIVLIAELIVRSALGRTESRGGHYRADHPGKLSCQQETILRTTQNLSPLQTMRS